MRPDPLRPAPPTASGLALLAAAALLLQGLLVANPGYFSHDELQWAVRAAAREPAGWAAIDALQYRPLTFELWMALSRAFFDTPRLFHLAIAVLGAANAVLLAVVLRGAGSTPRVADTAALAFVASPYAMYVHGWVATIGDLLWVGCALGIGWAVLRARTRVAVAAALLLTAAALLAKESALAIPATAAVLVLVDAGRRRRWIAVCIASGAVALAYLALRYPALSAPRPGEAYAWSPLNLPLRWLEYQLYPPRPRVFEVHNVLAPPVLAAFAGLLWLAVAAVLARRGRRWLLAWVAGGVATLGPVLVLGQSATQYGYGFAAWCAGLLGLAWAGLARPGRAIVAAFVLASASHGVEVAWQMHRVGRVEARFSADVLGVIATSPLPVRLSPAPEADAWIFQRVTHAVPSYRGVPFSPRIELVAPGAPADYRIGADGSLTALPR